MLLESTKGFNVVKLLFSSYLIIFVPYIFEGKITEYIINNKWIANTGGVTDMNNALWLYIAVYFVLQMTIAATIEKVLFRR